MLERDLAMLPPADSGRPMSKSFALLVQNSRSAPDAHNRCVADAPFACLRTLIVAMTEFEGTSRSCPLYVPSANDKLPGMPKNPAETPESQKPTKIGVSDDLSREKLDRRVSVAPMMDWTDDH